MSDTRPDVIMVIRHGEKPTTAHATGFELDGTPQREALTIRGWQRAGALAAYFDPPQPQDLPNGLRRPDRIYAAKAEPAEHHLREQETVAPLAAKLGLHVHAHHPVPDIAHLGAEHHLREQETVAPLAAKLGLHVHAHHPVPDIAHLGAEVAKHSGATLVCWEHKILPTIVKGLGSVSPTPPTVWPDDRFDVVWVFTRAGAGWDFTQVPQLLLSGDSPDPIPHS